MNNIVLKIVLFGETGVGKTSIVNNYIYNLYNKTDECTIGAEFISKHLHIKYCKELFKIHDDDKFNKSTLNITLHIWDTAGQEKYKALVPLYFRCADIIFGVNDVTKSQLTYKFNNNVLNLLKDNCQKVIVFNKIDLNNNFINIHTSDDYIYKEVSAKSGKNIDDLFLSTISTYINNNLKYILDLNKPANVTFSEKSTKYNLCC
jgi:small GTP-binding protein